MTQTISRGYGICCWQPNEPSTPRIDRLAREGMKFNHFHSNSSVCSPTRVAFLTGRYQLRYGIVDVIVGREQADKSLPATVSAKTGLDPDQPGERRPSALHSTGRTWKWFDGQAPSTVVPESI